MCTYLFILVCAALCGVSGFVLQLGASMLWQTHYTATFQPTSCSSNISWSERRGGNGYALTTETGSQQLVRLQYPSDGCHAEDEEISAWLSGISAGSPLASFACVVKRDSSIVLPDGRIAMAGLMNQYRSKEYVLFFVLGAVCIIFALPVILWYTVPMCIAATRAFFEHVRSIARKATCAMFRLGAKDSITIQQVSVTTDVGKNIAGNDSESTTICLDRVANCDPEEWDFYLCEV